MNEAVNLKDFLQDVKGALEDMLPDSVWVMAEVSSVQARQNGHCYLELSQSEDGQVVAKARAVVWRSHWLPLSHYFEVAAGSPLSAGMSILAKIQVSFSEVYGLTLVITEIEPRYTLGAAELEKRRTIARLNEEGLMNLQSGLEPSVVPYRLAVISAPDAAGYGDFCRHLESNQYGFAFEVRLFESLMQGNEAPSSIACSLDRIAGASEKFDAVLIMRGGGSVLDMACFDDYSLCAAIARCPVPVYTAVGHDRDYHVCDMVAYRYVKTPTALADDFIDALCAEDERISSFATRLRMALSSRISLMESRVSLLESRIHSADPRNILQRGYVLVAGAGGKVLKKASGVSVGDSLDLLFSDGKLNVEVKNTTPNKNNNNFE